MVNFVNLLENIHQRDWIKILIRTPIHITKQVAMTLHKIGDSCTIEGSAPLHISAWIGNLEIFQYIFHNSIEKIPRNKVGGTPLHWAAYTGHLNIFKVYLHNQIDLNPTTNEGATPLHMSTFHGQLDITTFLINNNVEKDPKDNKGRTPLHDAAAKGHIQGWPYVLGRQVTSIHF